MTISIDVTREYTDLIAVLLAIGSGQEKPYDEAGWYNPMFNAGPEQWTQAVRANHELQLAVYKADSRSLPFTYI